MIVRKKEKGFSLTEVLVGLAVVIVASTVLIGQYNPITKRVCITGVTNHFRIIQQGIESYINEQTSSQTKKLPNASEYDENGGMANFIDSRIFESKADPWKRKYHFAVSSVSNPTGREGNQYPGGIQWMLVWSEGDISDNNDETGIQEYHGGFEKDMFTAPVRITKDGAIVGINEKMNVNNRNASGVDREYPYGDDPYMLLQLNENRTIQVIDRNLRNE